MNSAANPVLNPCITMMDSNTLGVVSSRYDMLAGSEGSETEVHNAANFGIYGYGLNTGHAVVIGPQRTTAIQRKHVERRAHERTATSWLVMEPLVTSASTYLRFTSQLYQWSYRFNSETFDVLQKYVSVLLSDQAELDADRINPSSESFSYLLSFFSAYPEMKVQYLSLSDAGNFVATWQPSRKIRFSIEFTKANLCRWVYVNSEQPQRVITGAGSVASGAIFDIARVYEALGFMRRAL